MEPVAPEGDVLDALEPGDVEADPVLEQPNMAGMDQHGLAGRQLIGGDLAGQLDPGLALPSRRWRINPSPPYIPPRKVCCMPMVGRMPSVPQIQP